jgi:hypothetical protein
VKRAVVAFGKFWWDFLVGDTPEFAAATVAVVGAAYLLHTVRDVGIVVLPVLALGSVALSARRARR